MLHLLWALINIAVFIIFISTCFRATRLIREKYGMLLAVIFVIGLLSFAGRDTNDADRDAGKSKIKSWKFPDSDSLQAGYPTGSVDVILDENLINKTRLTISYTKSPEGVRSPVEGWIGTLGFMAGTRWRPFSVDVDRTNDDNKFRYRVSSILEWKLLSATIYSQMKSAEGLVNIK
jgi:hypothetical protein